ncbi:ATPase [Sulfurospirillum arsenophilum]|uniref:ATPase n=1 Tax=Sulfurospirillum arsenophilum TaxID=56698 RepID=UPI0005A5ECC6|nr:ATPase [Sulfurospirillum arsenophilum]
MEPIYLDLHIHTSENEDDLNQDYNVDLLLSKIQETSKGSTFLISLTDHNTINKFAYMKLLEKTKNIILGVELHIWNTETKPPYHCHIYFDMQDITEIEIDNINKILDELYPTKKIQPPYEKKINIEEIIRRFDNYEFLLLPHGGQNHRTFNLSVDSNFDTRLEKSLYYNQFDGFTARNEKGLEDTIKYFKRLGINEFVNLVTCTDNYNPVKYPNAKDDEASPFIPTWMFAEPTFNGLRLSLSESTRLVYSNEKPKIWAEYIRSVKLNNEFVTINVNLTPGLNVVIGDSSSGKTLFVDTIVCKSSSDFSKSKYKSFLVQDVEINNPTNTIPHYINQNYIVELIGNGKNEIEKIDIIKNVFPDDKSVRLQIDTALLNLEKDVKVFIKSVENIEKAEKVLQKIPSLNTLIQFNGIQENIIKLLIPSSELSARIDYPVAIYEHHTKNLKEIKEFIAKNPFVNYQESDFEAIERTIENAYNLSTFENLIREHINACKINIDNLLLSLDTETQSKRDNFEKLIQNIEEYTSNLKFFQKQLIKLLGYSISIESKQIESSGHKLSIEYNFQLSQEIILNTINKFLKTDSKIESLDNLSPKKLYLEHYKDSPKIGTYDDFITKIIAEFKSKDKRKYKIITSDGKEFEKLSAGWKTSVLLDLILGYKEDNAPLIIDQPEDNLANGYINKGLIDAIKKIKIYKQIIIVSHNATIPMLGDAQNIVLCQNDGKINISSNPLEGYLDGKSVVDQVASITDGGKISIKKRVKKYNMKNFKETK